MKEMFKRIILPLAFLVLSLIIVGKVIAASSSVTGHKIVIDPGHGGSVSGSTECSGYPEKDANLDIAFRLKGLLEADGAEVFMTREDDSTKSNRDRYQFANSVNGEALVSVHLNGSTNHFKNRPIGGSKHPITLTGCILIGIIRIWKMKDF